MVLEQLVETASDPRKILSDFRSRCNKIGNVFTITYKRAVVAIYDYDREQAGGLPKNSFLLAAKETDDRSLILLRVKDATLLPNAQQNDITRQQGLDSSGGEVPWADELPDWTRDRLSLHGLECSVLGAFILDEGDYRYAEDIDNYYAVHELMVWKPSSEVLDIIVNHQHRSNEFSIDSGSLTAIGKTRFAAAEPSSAVSAEFRLNPTDIMKRRTVYLGMSRSGKSNGLKIFAEAVYRLRDSIGDECRVGQLIFDINGEYAQDNLQDGKALHRVHDSLGREREGEVSTYGMAKPQWDPERRLMKINFYGNQIPRPWNTDAAEEALTQLVAGREVIKNIMASETARYTTAFRDADIAVPRSIAKDDIGDQVRYYRLILAYRTALAAAGLTPPWETSIRGPVKYGLFSQKLLKAMSVDKNANSDNRTDYHQAAEILRNANENGFQISWDNLITVFTALNKFINDGKSGYDSFEQNYVSDPKNRGNAWADSQFKAVLRIFESQNGPRSFQTAREQHDAGQGRDYVDEVIDDLRAGKLVIVDQSGGDPEQNANAAERVMWRVFNAQQDLFKNRMAQGEQGEGGMNGHVIAYIEEAHNLLPSRSTPETLKGVWARSAKEGSKYNLGMVLATQAPSSIMPEILSETDNWIVAYLNSAKERRVVSDYMDFEDFVEQIGSVSEQGFVRIRTLSQAYTVPVQLNKFWLGEMDSQGSSDNPGSMNGVATQENTNRQLSL